MRRLVPLLFVCAVALVAQTEIRDLGYTGIGGSMFSGKMLVTAPDMTTADGRTVLRWQQEFTITAGVVSVDLEPNDLAQPSGTSYLVRFTPTKGMAWTERWVVLTSARPLRVNQVRVLNAPLPTVMIQPQQILRGGAASGQCLGWSGSLWVPIDCLNQNAVASVFGRTAAVTAQTGDYSAAQVGLGSVENTALSTWAGSTNLTTLGTVTAGTWHGAVIGDSYISSASTWNGKQAAISGAPGSWPSTFAPSAHASAHQDGGADQIATATPAANAIPKAGSGGTLGAGWIPALNQNTTGTAATATALAPNQGTTTTVLHGNASGTPAFAAVTESDFGVQNAAKVLAGPATGGDAAPTFRALAATDVPTLPYQAPISGAPGTWPSFGGAALANVGSTAGTVAAGDDLDTRFRQNLAYQAGVTIAGLAPANPRASAGAELTANGDLEACSWLVGYCQSLNWGGTTTATKSSDSHGGSWAQGMRTSGSGGGAIHWDPTVVAGSWYRASVWAKRTSGTAGDVTTAIYAGVDHAYHSTVITGTAYKRYDFTVHTAGTIFEFDGATSSASSSDTVVFDDGTVRLLPLASIMALRDGGAAYGKASATVTIGNDGAQGTEAGVVMCADSATNPQNFVLAYHDGLKLHWYKALWDGSKVVYTAIGSDGGIYHTNLYPYTVYAAGAAVQIHRASGGNVFKLYYNGRYIDTATVSDAAIVGNTIHGVLNTYEGNTVSFSYSPAKVGKTAVYLGGSITGGAGTSGGTGLSPGWVAQTEDWLDTTYLGIWWTHQLKAQGGTDSFYSLVRLQTDVLAYSPDIVFVDEAVNDGAISITDPAWPYVGEAIIRRIRAAYSNAKIAVMNFVRPPITDSNTITLANAWNAVAAAYKCDLYRLDTELFRLLGTNTPTTQQVAAYFSDSVHPNDLGHATIYNLLARGLNPLTPNAWSGRLADYARSIAAVADYEWNSTIVLGTDLAQTGTWSTNGTDVLSSTANSTLTYMGPMAMFGLDAAFGAGQGTLAYQIDGGTWTNVDLSQWAVSNQELSYAASRGVHTVVLKVVSGTVRVKRLLAI